MGFTELGVSRAAAVSNTSLRNVAQTGPAPDKLGHSPSGSKQDIWSELELELEVNSALEETRSDLYVKLWTVVLMNIKLKVN